MIFILQYVSVNRFILLHSEIEALFNIRTEIPLLEILKLIQIFQNLLKENLLMIFYTT